MFMTANSFSTLRLCTYVCEREKWSNCVCFTLPVTFRELSASVGWHKQCFDWPAVSSFNAQTLRENLCMTWRGKESALDTPQISVSSAATWLLYSFTFCFRLRSHSLYYLCAWMIHHTSVISFVHVVPVVQDRSLLPYSWYHKKVF